MILDLWTWLLLTVQSSVMLRRLLHSEYERINIIRDVVAIGHVLTSHEIPSVY